MMRHDEPATMMHLIRPLLLLLGVLALLVVAESASGDTVRVYDMAGSAGPDVLLSQVAELDGEYATKYKGVVVGRFEDGQTKLELKRDTIVEALKEKGVKLGLLDLQGYGKCVVHRTGDTQDRAKENKQEKPVSNVDTRSGSKAITVHTATTVRSLIERSIVKGVAADREDLVLSFDDKDADLLRSSAVAGRYEVEAAVVPTLGRVTYKVYAYSGTKRQGGAKTVTVRVQRRVLAVVAKTDIRRGGLINYRQVKLSEVLIDEEEQPYLTATKAVVGQVVKRSVKDGEIITADHIKMPIAVRRRQMVSVELKTRGIKITFKGISQGEGSVGDEVEVENPKTKQRFTATIVARGKVVAGSQDKAKAKKSEKSGGPSGKAESDKTKRNSKTK